jgi:integrase
MFGSGQRRSTKIHRGDANSGKRPFAATEVRKLREQRPTLALNAGNSLRWIVHIAAYSGMRLEEIASLTVADAQEVDAVHFFNVAKAKSKAGVRVVPIHSAVLAAGFLAYRDAVKDGPLLPALKARKLDGKRGRRITKLFAIMRRSLGLVDIDATTGRGRTDFHSLRRSAITSMRNADISEDAVAEIVGHEHGRITLGTYAGRQKLSRLQVIVEAIQYNR